MSENTSDFNSPKKSSGRVYIVLAILIVGAFVYFVFRSVQKRNEQEAQAKEASAQQTTRVRVAKSFSRTRYFSPAVARKCAGFS